MAALLSLATLLVKETKTAIFDKGLALAVTLGLPVTSWQPGDPTRSLYHLLSQELALVECVVAEFIAGGFLDFATGEFLQILGKQVYDVDFQDATFATTTVTLTNNGGGFFPDIVAGDLTFENTSTGKTYHNTSGGTLAAGPGTTLDVTVIADEAGSDSSAAAGEIDDLVTTLLSVTVTNAVAAVGIDAEQESAFKQRCRDKLGSLSPNGPRDAYNFVATTSELTGITTVTRSRSDSSSVTGDVTLYIAGPSGAVSASDVTAVQTAVDENARPLTITATVINSVNVVIPVTYELTLYVSVSKTTAEVEAAVAAALATSFAIQPIGGNIKSGIGAIHHSLIESVIRGVFPDQAFEVNVTTPPGDTVLTIGQVGVLGTVTPTITFVADP